MSLIASFVLPLPILSQAGLLFLAPAVGMFVIASATLLHELGHTAGAVVAGGRVKMIALYPLVIHLSPPRLMWRRTRRLWFSTGRAEYIFRKRHGQRYLLATLGGPLADLCTAFIPCLLLSFALLSPLSTSICVALFVIGLLQFVLNLLPCSGSDGQSALNTIRAHRLNVVRR